MSTLLRSEQMTLCQLFLQTETAYCCVSRLGELGLVQFRDINTNVQIFQRHYVNEVRRCEEIERKLRYFREEIHKINITEKEVKGNPMAPLQRDINDFETECEKLEKHLKQENANRIALKLNYLEMVELKQILSNAKYLFDESDNEPGDAESEFAGKVNLVPRDFIPRPQVGYITGVLPRNKFLNFERSIWRSCYGNVFVKHAEIGLQFIDPDTEEKISKVAFALFFQGERLKARSEKICNGYGAVLYRCPETKEERVKMLIDLNIRITDLQLILNKTIDEQYRLLSGLAKHVNVWFVKCRKIKAIYHTLNMFDMDIAKGCMVAEFWCAEKNINWVRQVLRLSTGESGSTVPSVLNRLSTKEVPPTYHNVNIFTSAFQTIVDSYGVASYREINPAPFTVITFPFIFAIMFGDVGHGVIMACFGMWMVYTEKKWLSIKKNNEIWNTIFAGRYVILLMGLFSVYTGFIYNDLFSKSFNIFGSSWNVFPTNTSDNYTENFISLDPQVSFSNKPYPIGIDPIWKYATNRILYLNSYKMKISIIFGVLHMTFGIFLSLMNHVYFDSNLDIISDFLPQILYLMLIFGYLVLLIFYKWIAYTAKESSCAPSLLMALINMFLYRYTSEPCYLAEIYKGQKTLQTAMLILAVVCIPWMIFLKPIAQRIFPGLCLSMQRHGGEGTEEGILNELVMQAILAIEFCLGTISHTASYLRLWALSLAHAELSEVVWMMILKVALGTRGYVGILAIFIIFPVWAFLTISVLLVMEGLSAFLHALRLHWVEFQSKFYHGQGYIFHPFYFETIIAEEEELSKRTGT